MNRKYKSATQVGCHEKQMTGKQTGLKSKAMTPERKIRILKNALNTILLEAKEPIIKVYAQSALDETVDAEVEQPGNSHCKKHNWFGAIEETCPFCPAPSELLKQLNP